MTPSTHQTPSKLSLTQFLKILTSNGVTVSKAMTVAGKIYKDYSTPANLIELSDVKLSAAGISDKEDRKLILNAFRKAGYAYKGKTVTKKEAIEKNIASGTNSLPSPSVTTSSKRKRKFSNSKNEFLPDDSQDRAAGTESFEFNETLDEKTLYNKSSVINRAPVMMAWAMAVAERLGFKREESLSIASVYTEINAVSKGVSLGVFNKGKRKLVEASSTSSQPYIDLIGRSPLYQTQEGQWRALSDGSPIFPGAAFSYISRSFKQTTPYIIGALRLLALSYPPNELNSKGWSLYAEFRSRAGGWGQRSEVKCRAILDLRKKDAMPLALGSSSFGEAALQNIQNVQQVIKVDALFDDKLPGDRDGSDEPRAKKVCTMTGDQFEAVQGNSTTCGDVEIKISTISDVDKADV